MSKINLLPTEMKEEIFYSKKNKAFFNIFIASLLMGLFLALFFLYGYSYLKSKGSSIDNLAASQEESVAVFGSLEKDANDVNERLIVYRKIDKERVYWSRALELIGEKTPQKVYLVTVKASDDTKTRGVITGNADNKMEIASFVSALKKSEYFEAVDIDMVNIVADPFFSRETNNFSLKFSLNLEKLK